MGEVKIAVEPVRIRYMCPDCDGELLPTGRNFMTSPPQYEHKCDKCDYTRAFSKKYPYITYEAKTDEANLC